MFKKMLSLLSITAFLSVILLSSCKKENSAVANTWWNVDNYSFEANNSAGVLMPTDTATLLMASSSNKDAIVILFKNTPTAGAYNLIDIRAKAKAVEYADNECSMLITQATDKKSYWSLYDDGGIVNISVSGKKVTAEFNNVKLGYVDLTTPALNVTEVTASGKIVEK